MNGKNRHCVSPSWFEKGTKLIFISKIDLDDYLQREYYLNHKSKRKSDFNKFVDSQDIDEYRANGKFVAYWVH